MKAHWFLLGTLLGCVGGDAPDAPDVEDRQDVVGAVWSDDGVEVATFHRTYVVLRYRIVNGGTIEQISDMSFTVYVKDWATGTERAVGEARRGTPNRIHFMRRAGYVLVTYREDELDRHFDRLDLATGAWTEARPVCIATDRIFCTAIPSPDGEVIAFLEKPLVPSNKTRVELRDAFDHGLLAEGERPSIDGNNRDRWQPQGGFLFTVHNDNDETWELDLDGTLREVTPVPCVEPATTSSAVDANGRALLPDGTLSELAGTPFGCQAP